MNDKITALYNGITNIDDDLIYEALADQENELKLVKIKSTAKIKVIKILSVAASIVFIVTVLFPTLVANVSAFGKIVETYAPGYFRYSKNFAINKPSVPESNFDKIIYYSELSVFHDIITSGMRGDFLDDVSVEDAASLLQNAEGLLNAASNGPISFLEYLGFTADSYSYTIDEEYFVTDIDYSKVVDATLSYFSNSVFQGILKNYVINRSGKVCLPCAKNENNMFEISTTKKNENGFFTSIITSGEKTYSVYYGIRRVNEKNVIGYYWCANYDEYDLPIRNENNPLPEVNENDIEEMRIVATEYMIIRAKWLSETILPIRYLGFSDEDTQNVEYIGSYMKTNIDYSEFYSKMLRFMTPELFKREYSTSYIELDGKLCVVNGGGSGWNFDEVLELIPTENGYYELVIKWKDDFEDKYYTDTASGKMFFEKVDNRWVVADYKTD